MPILAPLISPNTNPPIESDLETWARQFILSPASTDRDWRERRIVAQLLADVEAQR